MGTHKIYFCEEIRFIHILFGWKTGALSRAMNYSMQYYICFHMLNILSSQILWVYIFFVYSFFVIVA